MIPDNIKGHTPGIEITQISLIFKLETTTINEFSKYGAGSDYYTYNCFIDWGDGTITNPTAFGDVGFEHTYVAIGIYTVVITGICQAFYPRSLSDGNTMKEQLLSVDNWGEVGLILVECARCLKLVSVASMKNIIPNLVVTDNVFFDCQVLETVIGNDWDFTGHTSISGFFNNCKALVNIDVSNWNVSTIIVFTDMFRDCHAVPVLDVSNWNMSSASILRTLFFLCQSVEVLDVSNWDVQNLENSEYLFADNLSLTVPVDVSNWVTSSLEKTSYMFRNYPLSTITGLNNLDMSNVLTSWFMFYSTSLTSINVSSWVMPLNESIANMFEKSQNLVSIDVSNWDMSACKNMKSVFYDAFSLTTITGLKNWNVQNVTTFENFARRSGITSIDISGWQCLSVVTFRTFCYQCFDLATVDVSGVNVINATTLEYMFAFTSILTVINAGDWTLNPTGLTTIGLRYFNLSGVSTTAAYDAILIGWTGWVGGVATKTLPNNISMDFNITKATSGGDAEDARAWLLSKGWILTDGGLT